MSNYEHYKKHVNRADELVAEHEATVADSPEDTYAKKNLEMIKALHARVKRQHRYYAEHENIDDQG